MSVSGLCEICQSAEVVDRCERCGTMVCADHLDRASGLCMPCARGSDQDTDRPDEGDVYR